MQQKTIQKHFRGFSLLGTIQNHHIPVLRLPNLVCHIRTIQKLFGNTIKLNLKGQIAAIAEDAQKKVLNVFKVKKLVQ